MNGRYYALQFRNLPVLRRLSERKHVSALIECIGEFDAYNETMLHIAARSKTAGFARVFVSMSRLSPERRDPKHNAILPLLGECARASV
jgi:hypothetical protein